MGAAGLFAGAAPLCSPAQVQGVYGFQLSGETTISGGRQPAASVGRLVLDGMGNVSGVSSVNFAGYFLGNSVTGTYQAHNDCSISWSLQDDSGAYQHFSGTVTPDGKQVQFRQTDEGAARHGIMSQAPASCSAGDFRGRYRFSISGRTIPMLEGQAGGTVSLQGTAETDGGGGISVRLQDASGASPTGTAEVGDDCFVQVDLPVPATGGQMGSRKFRAMLVDGGKHLIGVETDPGAIVTLRMDAAR